MIYLSGPISGRHFEEAQKHFNDAEDFVFLHMESFCMNPMKLPHNHNLSWEEYMKEDIAALMKCNGIYMLRGWDKSPGARLEYRIAVELNYNIYFEK